MRPRSLDEVLGQKHLLRPGAPLRNLLEAAKKGQRPATSLILWGPAGTGKTTFAYLLAAATEWNFTEISAVTDGLARVRQVIEEAKRELSMGGKPTILFVDEVHRFSKSQQDALLPAVENRWVTLVAATTENPIFSVINPLLSRSIMLTLDSLDESDLVSLVQRAISSERGLGGKVTLSDEVAKQIALLSAGDARKALTILEAAANSLINHADGIAESSKEITSEMIELVVNQASVDYGINQHYDIASAFIKSMRGSDPDATVFYLAKMLVAGEDPRFIARRIVIAASEDVGTADPSVLPVAVAAFEAVSKVGMPEARIILAEAAITVATAPKSNAAYKAINAAIEDVKSGLGNDIPPYLRDAHNPRSSSADYIYPHDCPGGLSPQTYLPESLLGRRYYEPSNRGFEVRITERLERVHERRKFQ
ncbi:replication-associated recombination protein A [Actinomycetaceae bacterium TAE3-ERU4]|nr:replication-associated recombination protein A [Actinomycetaceae bacterium TAE3-ERU4]